MSATALAQREAIARVGGHETDPAFHLAGWDVDGEVVALRYRIDGLGAFTETITFPGHDVAAAAAGSPATRGALRLLHLAASTSYYKTVIPRRIELGEVPAAARRMLEALVTHGLAEFAARNGIDLAGWAEVGATIAPDAAPAARPAGVLVPVGGGKDSAVTASLVVRAGLDAAAFAVNPRPSMRRTAEAVGLPLLTAERRLDPRLLALNDAGALNGHVPITAIVASIALVAATLTGRGDVLLSNEASADAPTRLVQGREVNHQYSKSSAFEALHRAASRALTGDATRAVSVLRPLPELAVAAAFTHLGAPLDAVNSCNRAYTLTGEAREWCGDCPKCRFVQLMLAPFTTPPAFQAATGFDALADPAQLPGFADLLDPQRKPYECVGTREEVQLAFDLLAADPAWEQHAVVRALGRADGSSASKPRAALRALLSGVDAAGLPVPYADLVDGLLRELRASFDDVEVSDHAASQSEASHHAASHDAASHHAPRHHAPPPRASDPEPEA